MLYQKLRSVKLYDINLSHPLGHYAVACRHGRDVVLHHNCQVIRYLSPGGGGGGGGGFTLFLKISCFYH